LPSIQTVRRDSRLDSSFLESPKKLQPLMLARRVS